MLRAPGAKKHAGTRPDRRRGPAAPERRAQRSGKGMPPAPPRTHRAPRPRPSGPQACSQRRRRWRRLSRRGHGQGEGKGKHPGVRTQGCCAAPRGRCRTRGKGLEGALLRGGRRLRGPPGPRGLPGPLSAPGGGVAGPSRAPAPQHKQAPDAEPPGSAGGGGGTRGGPGSLVTPPCPGLAAQHGAGPTL